jgi:hypothetical protein
MSDIPIKSDRETLLDETLRTLMKLLAAYNEQFGKIHASLAVLRKAIASNYPDPEVAEGHLRQLEADAQALILETQGFPELAAFSALLEARKTGDKLDS